MGLSRQMRRDLLNHFFNKSAMTSKTVFYVGVSLTLPTSQGSNITEPSDPSYARKGTSSANWNAATDADPAAIILNTNLVFTQASADWFGGTSVPYAVIYSALTGGTFYGFGEFVRAKPIYQDDILTIASGKLIVSLS